MKKSRIFCILSLLACATGLIWTALSCDQKDPQDRVVLEITLDNNELPGQKAVYPLHVSADGSWTITKDADWLRVSPNEGVGSQDVELTVQANNSNADRVCTLVIENSRTSSRCHVKQLKSGEIDAPGWLELPAIKNDDDHFFVTHDFQAEGNTYRNYAYFLNKDGKVAEWVAYPLNAGLKGSGSRDDAWGTEEAPNLDPKVSREYQAVLHHAYTDKSSYDRGHQIPSADRYRGNSNAMTYYGTNMTPQRKNFNQGIWATLENKVRSWANQYSKPDGVDTLYVVTGCSLEGVKDYTTDNDGKKIAVPTGYYKALLAYKKDTKFGVNGYSSIAFYFDHKDYPNTDAAIFEQAMTVNELEKKLGIDFFANLPALIGSENAEAVEDLEDKWFRNN